MWCAARPFLAGATRPWRGGRQAEGVEVKSSDISMKLATSRAALLRGLLCASTLPPNALLNAPGAFLAPPPAAAAELPPLATAGVTTRSGLQFIDVKVGDGPLPRFGQLIRFNYVTYALDETNAERPLLQLDTSFDRKPYFTKHGNGLTCQGVEEALHTMKVGGRRRVVVPAKLGYTGDKGPLPPNNSAREKLFKSVGANEPLIFDLELVSVMDDLLDRGEYEDGDADDLGKALQAAAASSGGDVPKKNPLVLSPST